jgi:DNA polymerase I-like protein with 3'-5' exonuclease and polymerase domains
MLAAYQAGMDLHAITAASMAGMSLADFMALEKTDKELFTRLRTNGKAGNFGLLYGMGAEGFRAYAWSNYGVVLSLAEAQELRDTFLFEQWTGLPRFHERMRTLVREQGWVRSPLGRIRHLPMIRSRDPEVRSRAERQAINSPIQSGLNDMMLMAIARIEAELGDQVAIAIMTHDSVSGYVDEGRAEELIPQVQEIMATLPLHELGWQPELVFTAEGKLGPNLAQMKKLKLAA